MLRSLSGAALMGAGGAMAYGCTVGQGLTGLSTLALPSFIAVVGYLGGAWAGLRGPIRVPALSPSPVAGRSHELSAIVSDRIEQPYSVHSRAGGNPALAIMQDTFSATLGPRFRGDERRETYRSFTPRSACARC